MPLLRIGFVLVLLALSSSLSAQSANTTPEFEGVTVVFPNAGGAYAPRSFGSFDLVKEASGTDDIATYPDVTLHFEAGAWGSGGNEPMAFAFVRGYFDTVPSVNYLRAPIPTVGYARVPCTRDVDAHCECIRPDPDECYHYTISAAAVRTLYRLVNTSGMTLPGNVSLIPVLLDYNVKLGITPIGILPEGEAFGLSASIRLAYPSGQSSFSRTLNCTGNGCSSSTMNPAPSEGTLEVPVEVRAAEELTLDVSATVYVNDQPACAPIMALPNDPCLVPPYGGDAWVLTDPYVYIDPSWEYADWFDVETSADGITWLPAIRTTVDLSTLGLEDGNGLPDGGVPDAGAGGEGGAGGSAGAGGTAGNSGTGGGNAPKSGGGCSVDRSNSSKSHVSLLLLLGALAAARYRRRRSPVRD